MLKNQTLGKQAGFTLVELMVAITVASIVIIAMYAAYRLQVQTAAAQDSVTQMQQNQRAGLDILIDDLRMAGYDPEETDKFGFEISATFSDGAANTEAVTTNATTLAFTLDVDGDGNLDKSPEDVNGDGVIDMAEMEQIAYRLNNMKLERYSTIAGTSEWQTVAEDIEAIELYYTLEDGTKTLAPTAAQAVSIRSIDISLLARSEQRDAKFTNNDTYTPASGTAWDLSGDPGDGTDAPGDGYRRRLVVATVECRNMGL